MRYRLMATYRGVPYEAGVGPTGGDVVLFAACPPPEELNFEPATGHWRKQVIWAEVDGLWESRPVGIFSGEPCIVLDDLGDRLHIAYLGTDADRAARLGYWQVDRGVFELLAPREEVTSLAEERVERPLRFASRAASGAGAPSGDAQPARPTYPYGAPGWPSPPPPHPDFPHSRDGAVPPAAGEHPTGALPLTPLPPEPRLTMPLPPEPEPRGAARLSEPGLPGPDAGTPVPAQAVSADPATDLGLPPTGQFPGEQASAPPAPPGHFPGGPFDGVVLPGEPFPGAPVPADHFPGDHFPGGADNGQPTGEPFAGSPIAGQHLAGFHLAGEAWPGHDPAPADTQADEDRGRGYDPAGGRSARRQRVTTRDIFCDLADLAAIPRSAYALESEVDGAMCLLPHGEGFEVFVAVDGARHEVRTFADEEAAYFYLFGVLVAEAIRAGALRPAGTSAYPER